MLHDLEALQDWHTVPLSNVAHGGDVAKPVLQLLKLRIVLVVDQNDIDVRLLQPLNALRQQLLEGIDRHLPDRVVHAGLPKNKLRLFRQHVLVEPRNHVPSKLPANPGVDHPNFAARPDLTQLSFKPRRIASARLACTGARRAGRAKRHDLQRRIALVLNRHSEARQRRRQTNHVFGNAAGQHMAGRQTDCDKGERADRQQPYSAGVMANGARDV